MKFILQRKANEKMSRYNLENSKEEKADRALDLKGQVSRIYMNTVAANEREDRLLNKKLDAIDLEHRAQFLRMKKVIRDAKSFSNKRLQLLSGEKRLSHDNTKYHTAQADATTRCLGWCDDLNCTLKNNGGSGQIQEDNQFANTQKLNNQQGGRLSKSQSLGARLNQMEALNDEELIGRLQYTEKEVSRIRKSWAAQVVTPTRKRTFLPHLEKQPDIKAPSVKGEHGRVTKGEGERCPCQPQAIRGPRRENNLPEIRAEPMSRSLELRTKLTCNNASFLRTLKRESAALSKSLPSSF